ncbi:MAG: hypothetical protein QJR03_00725 [Sphaerobacter sp.]|nr:hypothetical protein [Sphaerobacter sp.]
MTARLGQILGAAGYLAAIGYAYLAIGFPNSYEITRLSMQLHLFALGLLLALVIRSFRAVVLVPAAVIFAMVAAGIRDGVISDARQLVAATATTEIFLFGAIALGTFVGTALPRLVRRIGRTRARPEPPAALPPQSPSEEPEPLDPA